MSTSPLSVDNISKSFAQKKVLNDISFSLNEGEIFGLVGLNGVGKTTLIKIILDLLSQDSGSVSFFGNSSRSPESRKKISYLPEKFYPSGYLKGKEFLSLALSYHKQKLDIKEAEELASTLLLEPGVLHHKVNKYSKGMGQKLGLLSMFLAKTPFLLLDEPMSGLDPSARIQLKQLLSDYKKKGHTIFFSSHILSDIEEICDRMAVLHAGEIIYIDSPSKFLKKHKETNLERAFLKAIQA
jgi:ABC-2 type transport system ATP-binding protein